MLKSRLLLDKNFTSQLSANSSSNSDYIISLAHYIILIYTSVVQYYCLIGKNFDEENEIKKSFGGKGGFISELYK